MRHSTLATISAAAAALCSLTAPVAAQSSKVETFEANGPSKSEACSNVQSHAPRMGSVWKATIGPLGPCECRDSGVECITARWTCTVDAQVIRKRP